MKLRVAAVVAVFVAGSADAATVRIGIGHQSMCTDTYSAGVIVKELKLIEKYLPKDGKYKRVKYSLDWKDYTSGPPITNMMLANKLDFGVMGDYPLIVNGAKFQETRKMRSLYIAGTGYNMRGSGNALVVPVGSDAYSFEDLKNREVSVPEGSAAWGMTLKAMHDIGLSSDVIKLKNQSPPVGAANIANQKIAAHADFCPWPEIMEFQGTGRKIYDGSETGVPYLHGVVVRKDYADKYPEVVVAFMKAIIEAGNWVQEDPVGAAESLEKWTGVPKEVQYLYFGKGGTLTLDPTIKKPWIDALTLQHGVLAREKAIPPLNMDEWIDDRFIRQAYAESGLDYEAQARQMVDPKSANKALPPAEIWHPGKGIESYASVADMLKATADYEAAGQAINASYVYDELTGLKLFGKVAFYVKTADGVFKTFMRKPDAVAYADRSGGSLLGIKEAVGSMKGAGLNAASAEGQ